AGQVRDQLSVGRPSDPGQKRLAHMYNFPLDCSTREEEFRKDIAARYDDPKPALPQLLPGNAEVLASYSRQKCMALFARFARNGTWLCPTLHNSWRHAHNADAALIEDERARFYPEVFRDSGKSQQSAECRRAT